MTLLVTTLLMMINFASDINNRSPTVNTITAMDVWMLGTCSNEGKS